MVNGNRIEGGPKTASISFTAAVLDDSITYCEISPKNENPNDNPAYGYIEPRTSKTTREHLRLFPQELEFEKSFLKRRQLVGRTPYGTIEAPKIIRVAVPNGKDKFGNDQFVYKDITANLVETTDEVFRIVGKSDKTLLTPGKPNNDRDITTRITSKSKRKKYDGSSSDPVCIEVPTKLPNETDDKF